LVGTINFWGLDDFLTGTGPPRVLLSLSFENNILERGCDLGILTWGRVGLEEEEDEDDPIGEGGFWGAPVLIPTTANVAPGRVYGDVLAR
jgi:hypothetical protein